LTTREKEYKGNITRKIIQSRLRRKDYTGKITQERLGREDTRGLRGMEKGIKKGEA
jgi:hypothetical protein